MNLKIYHTIQGKKHKEKKKNKKEMGSRGLVNKCFMTICSIVLIMLAIGGSTPCSSASLSLEEGSKYEHPLSKWKVGISNEMVGPNQTLTIHCKSKDDDLGERNLNVGQSFEWEFKENLISTTLYWCTFNTHPLNYHAAFQVFWREKGE